MLTEILSQRAAKPKTTNQPMQVSQFLSSEIICLLSFFCDRVSCSHGLSLQHPNNEHQPLTTLSYIMDLLNSNDCFEH